MPDESSSQEKRAIITFVTPGPDPEKLKLRKAGTIFGRENGDILLKDHGVSATHCQIQYINGDYLIFDMNSSNGTQVNGESVLKQKLNSGDRVAIGKTEFIFTLEDPNQVAHISTIYQGLDELSSPGDKTSIVDTLLENEIRNTQRWEVHIHAHYADGLEEEYRIQQSTIFIGRATSFGRFEEDGGISRRHLMIRLNNNGEVFIEDEGSTNGSFLNGQKIQGIHMVSPDDDVQIGSCNLKIKSYSRSA